MEINNKSSEDYLERILMLQEEGNKRVHSIDIANSFNFSRASVSIAMKKLKEEGFIEITSKKKIILTPSGMEIASNILERHHIIEGILISLGVDENLAEEDACKIEHVISEKSFQAIKQYYLENRKD